MRFQSIVLILFILFASLATNQALRNSSRVDINDPHVIDIGNFAVTEYNKHNNEAKLIFEKVTNGVVDTVDDVMKYRLTLSTNNGSVSYNFGAIVLEKPLEHLRNLIAFALISRA